MAALENPSAIAIIDNTNVTYKELLQAVEETVVYYHSKGISAGDRVLVFVPMSVELYVNLLAILYLGAVPVFIDEWAGRKRLNLCCELAQCKAFVAPAKIRWLAFFYKSLRKIPVWLKSKSFTANSKVQFSTQPLSPETRNIEHTALITFTTGSTGIPKAAIRTHGILDAQFTALKEKTGVKNGEVVMTTLPIVLLINLGVGATSVIARFKPAKPWKLKPADIFSQMEKLSVTTLIASPFFILRLAQSKEKSVTVRKIFTGGAPVFPHEAEIIQTGFPMAHTEIVFGSTEAEPVSSITANELKETVNIVSNKGLKVGKIHPVAEVRIVPFKPHAWNILEENEIENYFLESGSYGEIIVAGEHVVKNYLDNEKAFAENKIVSGNKIWHRTGDGGYLDEDENLWLLGRCKQTFHYNGKLISPFIYENLLKQMDGIKCGTVLMLNHQLTAVVELNSGHQKSAAELKFLSGNLECENIRIVKQIPLDPRHFSKIDYDKLKQIIG